MLDHVGIMPPSTGPGYQLACAERLMASGCKIAKLPFVVYSQNVYGRFWMAGAFCFSDTLGKECVQWAFFLLIVRIA